MNFPAGMGTNALAGLADTGAAEGAGAVAAPDGGAAAGALATGLAGAGGGVGPVEPDGFGSQAVIAKAKPSRGNQRI